VSRPKKRLSQRTALTVTCTGTPRPNGIHPALMSGADQKLRLWVLGAGCADTSNGDRSCVGLPCAPTWDLFVPRRAVRIPTQRRSDCLSLAASRSRIDEPSEFSAVELGDLLDETPQR
jgi:hypothetical protein